MFEFFETFVLLSFIVAVLAILGFWTVKLLAPLMKYRSTMRNVAMYASMTHVVIMAIYLIVAMIVL